jgi:hypothetical protein
MTTIAQRIEKLLDQLEAPSLTEQEINKINQKLAVLRKQQSESVPAE